MTIQMLYQIAFSPLVSPKDRGNITLNLYSLSVWGVVGTGCLAGVSVLFHSNITPYVFQASAASCATCLVIAAYLARQMCTLACIRENWEKIDARSTLLEKRIIFVSGMGMVTAFFAQIFFKSDDVVYPLLGIGITAIIMRIFHTQQNQKIVNSMRRYK